MRKIILAIICCTSISVFANDSTMEFLAYIKPGFINEFCTNKDLPYHRIYKNDPSQCTQAMDKAFKYCISSGILHIPKTINDKKETGALGANLSICIARNLK